MIKLFRRNTPQSREPVAPPVEAEAAADGVPETAVVPETVAVPPAPEPEPDAAAEPRKGWFSRLKAGLGKTRQSLADGLSNLLLGRKVLDDALLEELETCLLMADVGVATTRTILDGLAQRVRRKELADADALYRALREQMTEVLQPSTHPLQVDTSRKPFVILMVGVNGAGKTTTIGKLAQRFQREGKSVMLAAGDTFRAAAVEQLQVWGDRNGVPVISQASGADSASVIFDALQSARARGCDVLIADTAGRLHVKNNLMEELRKITRVLQKLDASAPHEVMLVLDAATGQNGLAQARHFLDAVGVSGIVLTKLDGTARGGIVFAVSGTLKLPIRFIGVGEGIEDLQPFDATEFVTALLGDGNG